MFHGGRGAFGVSELIHHESKKEIWRLTKIMDVWSSCNPDHRHSEQAAEPPDLAGDVTDNRGAVVRRSLCVPVVDETRAPMLNL